MNVTNLEPVLRRRVTLYALPIEFTGSDGAPARVVAILD
jgi:kynurenine formamidase